jgi:hypothetical protein
MASFIQHEAVVSGDSADSTDSTDSESDDSSSSVDLDEYDYNDGFLVEDAEETQENDSPPQCMIDLEIERERATTFRLLYENLHGQHRILQQRIIKLRKIITILKKKTAKLKKEYRER